ncbi:MAG: NnrU family protein [Marinomonas colpomeniae]
MLILVVGLAIFFAVHCVRLFIPDWRKMVVTKAGLMSWRVRFGMLSLLSIGFIFMGYGQARLAPVWLWFPPVFMPHITSLIMFVALFFFCSAVVPKTTLRRVTGYPLYLAVKLWAFAHLLSNGNLADVLLFGSFLIWAIASYAIFRSRDRKAGVKAEESNIRFDLIALGFTFVSWFAIVLFFHKAVIGVSPLV